MTKSYQILNEALGYTFKNIKLLEQALTHRSLHAKHNERLEFLGDAVLGLTITSALFTRYPNAPEGELSHIRATLVCEQTLVILAQQFQLGDYIRVGPSEKRQYKKRPALLADVLEAIIGAIYLEAEWQVCEACILRWYQDRLEKVQYAAPVKDAKTTLQEYLQGQGKHLPSYQLVSQTGSSHAPCFTIKCSLPDVAELPSTQGIASNRREAEQQAASKLLALLQDHAEHSQSDRNQPLDDY